MLMLSVILPGVMGQRQFPNLIIFKDGKAVDQITGFVPEMKL